MRSAPRGPDIVSMAVSNTKTAVTFRVRFASAPPLRVSTHEGWADMLLIGVDVPPLGPRQSFPGGPWLGANFALGTHGPSKTGRMARLGEGIPARLRLVASFKIFTSGSTLTLSVPRRALGSPAWFTFTVAAAREMEKEATGGGVDVAPNRGTFRTHRLTGHRILLVDRLSIKLGRSSFPNADLHCRRPAANEPSIPLDLCCFR